VAPKGATHFDANAAAEAAPLQKLKAIATANRCATRNTIAVENQME